MREMPVEVQREVLKLFHKGKTVREISDVVRQDKKDVLIFLTKLGHWSEYCSNCVLKKCYDCRGLKEIGQPKPVQDQIDLAARLKGK